MPPILRILVTPLRFAPLLLTITFSTFALPNPQETQSGTSLSQPELAGLPSANSPVVYISDFDLDVVRRKPSQKAAARTSSRPANAGSSRTPSGVPRAPSPSISGSATSQSADSSNVSTEETPTDQARALVNAVSENIIRALTQAGYDARRLPAGAPLPKQGLRIRGVFAEADELNRARRLLVGGEPAGSTIILFVGVNNLKSQEQPLYELANPPANDARHGPVITMTSYTPAARLELPRDPSDKDLQKIATQIAADLTALLDANPLLSVQ